MSNSSWILGIACGIIIGMEYIPHQLKKKNPKIIKKIKDILRDIGEIE